MVRLQYCGACAVHYRTIRARLATSIHQVRRDHTGGGGGPTQSDAGCTPDSGCVGCRRVQSDRPGTAHADMWKVRSEQRDWVWLAQPATVRDNSQ